MPKPTAVVQVEGVLRKPVTSGVLETGRRLYHGLAGTFRIVLVTWETPVRLAPWLGMEGFDKHDHIVYPVNWPQARIPEWLNVARTLTLAYGYNTELVVVPDPGDAAVLLEHGYSTLLFTDAAYSLPEWRPDHKAGVQPWDALVSEITTQRALREADKRTKEDPLR
jgi:hypothetical protein